MTDTQTPEARLREEFNEWADAGRGEGMRKGHWDMTLQTIEMMDLTGDETVLDLGCGNGWAVRELAKMLPDGSVNGIDISDKMINEARDKSSDLVNVNYEVTSADKLGFDDAMFDHILSVESFYYYPKLKPVLAEIMRILKPGGRFWCVVDLYKENRFSMTWPEQLNVAVHALGKAEYRELFSTARLSVPIQKRIIDRRPVTRDRFKPGWGTPTFEDYQEYKSIGSLLTVGEKPG